MCNFPKTGNSSPKISLFTLMLFHNIVEMMTVNSEQALNIFPQIHCDSLTTKHETYVDTLWLSSCEITEKSSRVAFSTAEQQFTQRHYSFSTAWVLKHFQVQGINGWGYFTSRLPWWQRIRPQHRHLYKWRLGMLCFREIPHLLIIHNDGFGFFYR